MTAPVRLPARKAQMPRPGEIFELAPRTMTRERMRWYVDAQATAVANDGKPRFGGPTIHDDDDYAISQGLPGIIADGMVSTNWLFSLLVEIFGPAAAASGRMRTRYIAPVYEDDVLHTSAKVTAVEYTGDTRSVQLELRCARADGTPVTVGEATVRITDDTD